MNDDKLESNPCFDSIEKATEVVKVLQGLSWEQAHEVLDRTKSGLMVNSFVKYSPSNEF